MNTVRRVAKNSGVSFLTQISTPASSFVLVLFIARHLGVSGLGQFSSALSLLHVFQAFCSLGFSYLVTRDVAQDKSQASRYLSNASILAAVFSLIMVGVMCICVNLITDDHQIINAVYVLSLSLIPYALGSVCDAICKAFERLEYITISQVVGALLRVSVGLILLFNGYGLVSLMAGMVASYLVSFCISLYLALLCIPERKFRVDYRFCKWIVRATPVFALIIIANELRWNIDTLILTKFMGSKEVGFYSAALRLMRIAQLGLSCYIVAIQPVIFRLYKSSIEKFILVCEESMRYLLILLVPIAVATTLLSHRLIVLVFKPEFEPGAYALSILIWILIVSSDNLIFANALVASNNQAINLKGNVLSMIANLILNLILIPKFSFIGAAIANVLSSLILFRYQYHYVSKHLFKVNYFEQLKKPLVASAFMGACILVIGKTNLLLIVIISVIAYFSALVALNTFTQKDISLLRKIWRREETFIVTQHDA